MAARDTALRGDPTKGERGCLGRVDPFVPLEDPECQRWQQGRNRIDDDAADASEVGAVLVAWSDCMADAGHPGCSGALDPANERLQAELIDEHRAELDAWHATVGGAGREPPG